MPVDRIHIQCLLLVNPEDELEAHINGAGSRSQAPKGYVFLPRECINHPACEIFSENDVQVITENSITPARSSSFVVIEVLLSNDKVASSPDVYELYVDDFNKNFLQRLITIRNNQFIYKRWLKSTELGAINEDCLKVIENFLTAGASIRCRRHRYGTLIHFAAERGYDALIRMLLQHGTDVNEKRIIDGSTPLHLVAGTTRVSTNVATLTDTGRLLLREGGNIEAKMRDGSRPLHLAAERGRLDMIKLLVESGADIEAKKDGGGNRTPLHIVTDEGHESAVEYLLGRGANVNARIEVRSCMEAVTPLMIAVERGFHGIARRLLENGADVNARSSNHRSVLYFAVMSGDMEITNCVLEHRPDVNDAENRRAFRLAISQRYGSRIIVDKILELGFNLSPEDVNEPAYLFGAIQKNVFEIVEKLVNWGADVNRFYQYYDEVISPLHLAVRFAEGNIIQLLLDHGANVNSTRSPLDKRTPLLGAVWYPNTFGPETVELLLLNGADLSVIDCGSPPRSIAIMQHVYNINDEVVHVLMKFGASFNFQDITCWFGADVLCYGFFNIDPTAQDFIERSWMCPDIVRSTPTDKMEILVKHVIKLHAAFESVDARKIIPSVFYESLRLTDFLNQCEAEIANMKVESIGQTCVTLYDVLTGSVKDVACYAKNNIVERALKLYDFNTRYPIYGSILACHFQQGNLRRKLVLTGMKFFNRFLSQFSSLPDDIQEKVVCYLSNQDLLIVRKFFDTN